LELALTTYLGSFLLLLLMIEFDFIVEDALNDGGNYTWLPNNSFFLHWR
jgi:hypothetical protein